MDHPGLCGISFILIPPSFTFEVMVLSEEVGSIIKRLAHLSHSDSFIENQILIDMARFLQILIRRFSLISIGDGDVHFQSALSVNDNLALTLLTLLTLLALLLRWSLSLILVDGQIA